MKDSTMETDVPIFVITQNDLQNQAIEFIGRELNKEEMQIAKKGLENGIMTSLDCIFQTIFKEMIENEGN